MQRLSCRVPHHPGGHRAAWAAPAPAAQHAPCSPRAVAPAGGSWMNSPCCSTSSTAWQGAAPCVQPQAGRRMRRSPAGQWRAQAGSCQGPADVDQMDQMEFDLQHHTHQQPGEQASTSGRTSRRNLTISTAAAAAALAVSAQLGPALAPAPAHASKLPVFADKAWEAMGGGPSDLTFPDLFLGVWDVKSVLTQVETPLGEEMVPDMGVVRRAMQEDLNQPIGYQVGFIRNREDRVVFDRAFNTASMLSHYYGRPADDFKRRIEWNPSDPNILQLTMPGGLSIRVRVTRRSEEEVGPDRIETSEFFEQVYDSSGQATSSGPSPRVKASQCFTKYKWREQAPAGQPQIVATQVVSDYLTPVSDDSSKYMQAMNRPVVKYTYRMAFVRAVT